MNMEKHDAWQYNHFDSTTKYTHTYPYKVRQLCTRHQIIPNPYPANNLVAYVGKMCVQHCFAFSSFEVVVLHESEIEGTVDFGQIQEKPSIVVVWSIVWWVNGKSKFRLYLKWSNTSKGELDSFTANSDQF